MSTRNISPNILLRPNTANLEDGDKKNKNKNSFCLNDRIYGSYASINIPASAKHLTLVLPGNKELNSSQCKIDARPPAEHPERSAWNQNIHFCYQIFNRDNYLKNDWWKNTRSAFCIPFDIKSSIAAKNILWPLNCRLLACYAYKK